MIRWKKKSLSLPVRAEQNWVGREQTQEVSASARSNATLQLCCCVCVLVVAVHRDCAPTGNGLVGHLAEKWPKIKIKNPPKSVSFPLRLSHSLVASSYSAPPAVTSPPAVSDETAQSAPPSAVWNTWRSHKWMFFPLWDYFTCVSTCFDSRPYTILVFSPTAGFAAFMSADCISVFWLHYYKYLYLVTLARLLSWLVSLWLPSAGLTALKSHVTGDSAANVSLRNYICSARLTAARHLHIGEEMLPSKTSLASADLSDLPF